MEYQTYTLKNGIRAIHRQIPSKVAHCGIIINTGSRDENEKERGMAHFFEHAIFKATKKRKAFHIVSRIEDVGGELNAYTAKEETVVHATMLPRYINRAIELIADITFHSTFPEKELEKEKEVIIEEINSYKDSPAELIFDDFEELVFGDHPIGHNILGDENNIMKFTKKDLRNFISKNYHTDEMVFCSVGDISFKKLVYYLEKYFGHVPENYRKKQRIPFENYRPAKKVIPKNTFQTHCIIGCESYTMHSDKRRIMNLLANLLGGPAMNCRLNMTLREKHGLVYNIETFYTPYVDTGIFGIYFGTYNGRLEKSLSKIKKELQKLKEQPLGEIQLKKAKRQMIGQMAIASENYSNLMQYAGKKFLHFNYVESIDEISRDIEAFSAHQIQEVAIEMFDFNNLSVLVFE
mgnify:CR=1 FL=1